MTIWNLIARTAARPAVANWLIRRAIKTPFSHLPSNDDPSYMARYWLFNPYPESSSDRKRWQFPWSIRIHHIKREDHDRALHDHPWNARTIILKGWYTEKRRLELTDPMLTHALADLAKIMPVTNAEATQHFLRQPGDTAKLAYNEYHTITSVSDDGVWTLFISGPWRGVWGFLVDGVKIPWKTYLGVDAPAPIEGSALEVGTAVHQAIATGVGRPSLTPEQEHLLGLWQQRLDNHGQTLTAEQHQTLARCEQRSTDQLVIRDFGSDRRKSDPVAKEFANMYVEVVNERGRVIEHHNVVPIGKMGTPDTLRPSNLPMWDSCTGQAADAEEDANHQLVAYAGAIASLKPAKQRPCHPLTNIAKWQHGCSCAPTNNPVECSDCTLGLIASIEAWFKWQQGGAQ
jgi:hypothetical protein